MSVKKVSSRYNITVPLKEGRRIVYNSLTQAMAVWTAPEAQAFELICDGKQDQVSPKTFKDLHKGGFIVSEDLDEVAVLEKIYNNHRYNPGQVVLTIAPTMACNFVCDYCFQGQDKPHLTMGQEVQDAIVKMIESASSRIKSVSVCWYGGEPLIRRNVIETLSDRLIAVCKARKLAWGAQIVTNGYMLNLEAARSLRQRGVSWAQITLDGTPEYHDTRRYLLGGKGSFQKIVNNLKTIVDEVPIQYAIRVNIDDRNHKDIHSLIDYMVAQGLHHKRNLNMYFAPVEATTEGCHGVEDVTMTKHHYGQLEADLYAHGFAAGLTPLPVPPRFHGTCGAVRPSSLVILPTGDLHKCWDTVSWPDHKVGTIFNLPEVMKNDLMQKWLQWTPFQNHTCKNCKILPNCAGACAYKFIHAEETRGEAASLPCPSWKYNIKERLLQRAIGKGRVKPGDFDPAEVRTIPSELCADNIIDGGKALPENMQRYYEEQKKLKLSLPVVA
jgi:uncharacterized protein